MKRKGKVPFDPKVFLFRNSRPLNPLRRVSWHYN
jgi:hypothetical protein